MNTARLKIACPVVRLGVTASAVFRRPCTAQGWRPASVNTQPAAEEMNGSAIAPMASRRYHLVVSNRPRRHSSQPSSATSSDRLPA